MEGTSNTSTITAIPCGRDRHGNPITRVYTYEVDARREDWGDNRTRIFIRRPDLDVRGSKWGPAFAPAVVRTDSIREVSA